MAETANTPAPGTHPDAVVINENGGVDTRYGKGFVWVADEKTGAHYDVPASMLPRHGLRIIEGYPVNYSPHARPGKPAVLLGDLTPTAGRVVIADDAEPVSPELAAARTALAASAGTVHQPGTTPEPVAGAEAEAGDQAAAGDTSTTSTTSTKSTRTRGGAAAGEKASN